MLHPGAMIRHATPFAAPLATVPGAALRPPARATRATLATLATVVARLPRLWSSRRGLAQLGWVHGEGLQYLHEYRTDKLKVEYIYIYIWFHSIKKWVNIHNNVHLFTYMYVIKCVCVSHRGCEVSSRKTGTTASLAQAVVVSAFCSSCCG